MFFTGADFAIFTVFGVVCCLQVRWVGVRREFAHNSRSVAQDTAAVAAVIRTAEIEQIVDSAASLRV